MLVSPRHAARGHSNHAYVALTCDCDGTLLTRKQLARRTAAALDKLRNAGLKLILSTGESVKQLAAFPEVERFDLVVAENGAVLYRPASGRTKVLAKPPPAQLVTRLRKLGVAPLHAGDIIVATCKPFDITLQAVLSELKLDWHILYNRAEVMALPRGVDKATGLCAGLKELGLTTEVVIGVGDAQNDTDLLRCCGLGVAVATAVPLLKEQADLVTKGGSGIGVVQLIADLLAGNLPAPSKPRRFDRRPVESRAL